MTTSWSLSMLEWKSGRQVKDNPTRKCSNCQDCICFLFFLRRGVGGGNTFLLMATTVHFETAIARNSG